MYHTSHVVSVMYQMGHVVRMIADKRLCQTGHVVRVIAGKRLYHRGHVVRVMACVPDG